MSCDDDPDVSEAEADDELTVLLVSLGDDDVVDEELVEGLGDRPRFPLMLLGPELIRQIRFPGAEKYTRKQIAEEEP